MPEPTILVVDDNPELVAGLTDCLRDCGYAVIAAGSGAELTASLQSRQPDLILLDEDLPDGSGSHFLSALPGPLPPVVLMSGLAARAPGVAAVLQKPFTLRQLLEHVVRLLERRS